MANYGLSLQVHAVGIQSLPVETPVLTYNAQPQLLSETLEQIYLTPSVYIFHACETSVISIKLPRAVAGQKYVFLDQNYHLQCADPTGTLPQGAVFREQGIPSADFSIQALFFQISLHFYKLKPFIGAGGQCRHISCALGAEQGVSLLIIRASSSIPTLPAAVALLQLPNPCETVNFNHFCIYLLRNGTFTL